MDVWSDGNRLVLVGDFDVRSTGQVRAAIYEHLDRLDQDVVLDLSRVDTIDLIALRVLAVATRAAARSGRQLRLRGCQPPVHRLLLLSHLIHHVCIERSANDPLADPRPDPRADPCVDGAATA